MAQIKVTIDQMRSYARSLDERLTDRQKYVDRWIDSKINAALEMLATYRQSFYAEEVLDLTPYIIDGTDKFQTEMDGDVIGYKSIFLSNGQGLPNPLDLQYQIRPAITWTVNEDQSVEIVMDTNTLDPNDNHRITFQYYYIPTVPSTETYMSGDVWHMLRHAIQQTVWDALRDFEKANIAMANFKESTRTVVSGLDTSGTVQHGWNGGFIL